MNRILLFTLLATAFTFCGNKNERAKNSFWVSGKLTHNSEKILYLNELTTKGLRLIDSSAVNDDGTFSFKGNVAEKTFCVISFPKGATVIVLDMNSTVNLSIDADNPESFGISGSPETEDLKKLLLINSKYMLSLIHI